MSKTNSTSINLGGTLFLIFLVLKLIPGTPVNNWSWWWVTSPLWIPIVLIATFFAVIGIVAGIIAIIKWVMSR